MKFSGVVLTFFALLIIRHGFPLGLDYHRTKSNDQRGRKGRERGIERRRGERKRGRKGGTRGREGRRVERKEKGKGEI